MSDKSLTKKLLEDVMPEEEKPKYERKGYFDEGGAFGPSDDYMEGYDSLYGGSYMDSWDRSRGYSDHAVWDRGARGSSVSHNSAKQIIDSNSHGASKTISLDQHDSEELIAVFHRALDKEFAEAGIVLTQDATEELKASLLGVLDLCKWKSGVSLYDLRLR
jgi:hypothetical protein